MGNFQAVASGLGGAGEDIGVGLNNALTQALKVRQQNLAERSEAHGEDVDKAHIALAQAGQQQAYNIAQQQHELTRQQIIQSGWKDMGATVNPDGSYSRTFYNEQLPEGQNKKVVPLSGTPPDSPTALLQYYKNVREMKDENDKPIFTDLQAKQVAFKMPQLYREGPVGMMEGFKDYAGELSGRGVNKIKSSTGKLLDISKPEGQQAFAQDQLDLIYGRAGFFRAMTGAGNKDMTGWTAGEQREYNGVAQQVDKMEKLYTQMAMARMQGTFDPQEQAKIQTDLINTLQPMYKSVEEKYAEISNRHHGGIAFQVPFGAPPATGQKDGTPLYNSQGQIVAKAANGKWGPP